MWTFWCKRMSSLRKESLRLAANFLFKLVGAKVRADLAVLRVTRHPSSDLDENYQQVLHYICR